MSKVSVFKFSLNGQSNENINNIIQNYINSRGLYYNQEKRCYLTGRPSNTTKDVAISAGLSAAATVLSGGTTVIVKNTLQRGFEYYFNGNELIIKAFIYNAKGDAKYIMHSVMNNSKAGAMYYADFKTNLLNSLQTNNVTLVSTETEKIKDGSEGRLAKKLIIIFLSMIAVVTIAVALIINL